MSFSCMKCGMLTPTGDDEEFCSDHALNAFAEGRKQGIAEERARVVAFARSRIEQLVWGEGQRELERLASSIEHGAHVPKAGE